MPLLYRALCILFLSERLSDTRQASLIKIKKGRKEMGKQNWYEILGVSEQATEREIKAAFRRLSKENHPDEHPGDAACEERFKAVSEAYSILSDKEKRREYDRARGGVRKEAATSPQKEDQNAARGMSDLDFANINQSFASFFGFWPDTKEVVNESKMNPNRGNPLDGSDLFEKFMGIKR